MMHRRCLLSLVLSLALTAPAAALTLSQPAHTPREKVEFSFQFSTGTDPLGGVIADASGALYGTTHGGGSGAGTVFKLTPHGNRYKETLLYAFPGPSYYVGSYPAAGLYADAAGNLYGTTSYGGGSMFSGTAFELSPSSSGYLFQVLFDFGVDTWSGDTPMAGFSADIHGNLYTTTTEGGDCFGGTVFSLQAGVVHDFGCGAYSVNYPAATVTSDANGVLYGTAEYGGRGTCTYGCGIVYKLTPGASGFTKRTVYTFLGGSDGGNSAAAVTLASNGTIYGTTSTGGSAGKGTVFKLVPSAKSTSGYKLHTIYSFQGGSDGSTPVASVLLIGGRLYGTTSGGGSFGAGTVFELTPFHGEYTELTLHSFQGGTTDGASPVAGLIVENGALYGTTSGGGRYGGGTVFSLKP